MYTGLHRCVGERRTDAVRQSFEDVADEEQHVVDAACEELAASAVDQPLHGLGVPVALYLHTG